MTPTEKLLELMRQLPEIQREIKAYEEVGVKDIPFNWNISHLLRTAEKEGRNITINSWGDVFCYKEKVGLYEKSLRGVGYLDLSVPLLDEKNREALTKISEIICG